MKGACHAPARWVVLLALTGVRLAASAEGVQKIRDNSFLLEAAYNQEAGVIQHIQAFQYMRDNPAFSSLL